MGCVEGKKCEIRARQERNFEHGLEKGRVAGEFSFSKLWHQIYIYLNVWKGVVWGEEK